MFFSKTSKEDGGLLPTVEKIFGNRYTSKNTNNAESKSSSMPSHRPPKPTAIDTRSPTIQEPEHRALQVNLPSSESRPPQEKQQRPGLDRRRTTARTRYIDILLGFDRVSPLHNIAASLFVWILLAGYIVFPATFTKLQSEEVEEKADTNLKAAALRTVRNVSLLYIAAFACGIGIVGCLCLWWTHRRNYVWVMNRIFLPALLNSIAGLISTIVNVYSAQDGQYSVTAKVTIVVTAACSAVAAVLFLVYNMVMLRRVKRRHEREIEALEREEECR